MMNKIKLISIVSVFFFFYGCSDFLNTEPADRFSQDTYWLTPERVLAALNGVYNALTTSNMYGTQMPMFMECLSPNAYHYNGDDNLMTRGLHTASTPLFLYTWNQAYQGIGRANNLLGNIDRATSLNESLKARYIAEAKFLRALFYSHIWYLFGGGPLITEPTSVDQATLPRNSADEILAQILKDLDDASKPNVLPKSYSGADKGRVTIGAVLALKARILLYAGRFAEAAAAAKQVIDLNVYALFPDYQGLFYLENEGNSEVIFDVQFLYPKFCTGYDIQLYDYQSCVPLPDLVKDYYDKDGVPIDKSTIYNPAKPYENRDPRLKKTIVTRGTMFNGNVVPEANINRTGYLFKKYTVYKDSTHIPSITDGNSELNFIVLRYADVLLMYAEAQNEASGPDDGVYQYLNLVRKRAGMPNVTPGLSKDDLRKEIRHERRIELANEALYYYDIRRWGIVQDVMNGNIYQENGAVIELRVFENPRDYLWPVPSQAIQRNPNLVPQNPGYNL